ncbi:MAG TPA: hypothetical protein VG733_06175 [Chthoniobacteraceae bacterium]|nr:hypothetical protein [Chthoniobacteraceae bacterium]
MRWGVYADKEALHAAIRKAVAANGGKRISVRAFFAKSKMKKNDLLRNYSSWEEALKGAGFKFKAYHEPIDPGTLLGEWGEVVRKLGRLPSESEYRVHGPREATLLRRQFGAWHNVPSAFRRYARRRKEWADVLELVRTLPPPTDGRRRPLTLQMPAPGAARKMRDRPVYGDQLRLPSLWHAPSNEQGVVYLFGVLAERLGFAVERIQNAYPDCKAKRRTGRVAAWQDVLIEFEYASRNFKTHRHDPKGCDIIVCWEHNWPECPKNIEVIALSEAVKRLGIGNTVLGN